MKIAINGSPLSSGHQYRGIGTYARLLISALQEYYPEHTYIISHQSDVSDADVLHYPFFDLFFLTLPLVKSIPTIVTVHDVIPLIFPQAYPAGVRGTVKFWIQKASLSSVRHIVTDSNCSTNDVAHCLSQPKEKVTTVYLAADSTYAPASKQRIDEIKQIYRLTSPYFLYVGDINFNKNLPGLFQAFHKVKDEALLVIVSRTLRRDNPAAASLFSIIDELNLNDRMRILNDVPNQPTDHMRELYSGAHCYIQPSFYEGFGLPVLEAQACETPVISSTGGSLMEVCQDSTLLFEPHEIQALITHMLHSLEWSADDRRRLIDRGISNSHRFTWQKTAKAMIEIYSQCEN